MTINKKDMKLFARNFDLLAKEMKSPFDHCRLFVESEPEDSVKVSMHHETVREKLRKLNSTSNNSLEK